MYLNLFLKGLLAKVIYYVQRESIMQGTPKVLAS